MAKEDDLKDLFREGIAINNQPEPEMVNHPAHYNQFKREVIEEMRLIFGDEAVKSFCKLSTYKYIRRADFKGQKKRDLEKAEWYMDYLDQMEHEVQP